MAGSLRAVEFFSGIGAFAHAVDRAQAPIEIIAAFDQDRDARCVYHQNSGLAPSPRTLDSIPPSDIPPADLWWMSPPCQPYSRRGHQRDVDDPRAASLLHLIGCIPLHSPRWILLENVPGFASSRAREILLARLDSLNYHVHEKLLCPTQFGAPMRRPRWFLVACRDAMPAIPCPAPLGSTQPLAGFLRRSHSSELFLPATLAGQHARVFNIVDPSDPATIAICFTAQYGKCLKAAGSVIAVRDGRLRRFSPREILNLLGFSPSFKLPPGLTLRRAWHLTGNSADIRCLQHIIASMPATAPFPESTRGPS